MIDVAIAIDGEAVSMTRTRVICGDYTDDGKLAAGTLAVVPIMAVIQPTSGARLHSGNQLEDAPEGIRTEAQWMLWSRSDIAVDDQITHRDVAYRVLFAWPRDEGGFSRAALGRETP